MTRSNYWMLAGTVFMVMGTICALLGYDDPLPTILTGLILFSIGNTSND